MSRSIHMPFLLTLLGSSLLAGCMSVGPDYRGAPEISTGKGWTLPVADTEEADASAHWWQTLEDPTLDRLITQALAGNLDLRGAMARIDEARAMRDRAAGGQLPVVAAGSGVMRQRQSKNGPLPIASIPGMSVTQTVFDAGFDASWELDIFGGQRRQVESATARLHTAEAEARGLQLRIIAEVARNWFQASGAASELRAQRNIVDVTRQSLDLMHQRQKLGDASTADVEAAEAELASVSARLPEIMARQRAAVLALGVLVGGLPEQELALLDADAAPVRLRPFPVGARADMLRRRPDVLAAERRLASRTAEIGVATAELFPRLAISASGGFQAIDAADWFTGSSGRYSFGPFLSWRLFDGGRIRAEIRASKSRAEQAALAYEKTVLSALEDAERSLGNYQAGLDSLQQQSAALEAARRQHAHSVARLHAGDISRLQLLAADRQLLEAELAATRTHQNAAIQLVALTKALGGGWIERKKAVHVSN